MTTNGNIKGRRHRRKNGSARTTFNGGESVLFVLEMDPGNDNNTSGVTRNDICNSGPSENLGT